MINHNIEIDEIEGAASDQPHYYEVADAAGRDSLVNNDGYLLLIQ